jgi:CRISPR type III-B/RAMP module-associated protein Cmr5
MKLRTPERMKSVYELVKQQRNLLCEKKTVDFLKGLPSILRQNGLGPTLAFIRSKRIDGEVHYSAVDRILSKLLGERDGSLSFEAIFNMNSHAYIKKQEEAVELSAWIKEFALALQNEDRPAN